MKAILVIDVPILDDGRHLCNECPIWNKERYFCQYDFNTEAKGCPLKPVPNEKEEKEYVDQYDMGWNDCVRVLKGDYNLCKLG